MNETVSIYQGLEAVAVKSVRRILTHDGEYFFERQSVGVRALCTQGVEDVRDGQNAGREGKLVGGQPAPVAFPIEPFMVSGSIVAKIGERRNAPEDFVGINRDVRGRRRLPRR